MRGLVSAVGASVGSVEPVASLDGVFFQEVHALGVGRLLGGVPQNMPWWLIL